MNIIRVSEGKYEKEKYPNSLANSVHMALSTDGGNTFEVLNQGYGMLFKKANIRNDNTLQEMGCKKPVISKNGNVYFIAAEIADADGILSESPKYVIWKTEDFIEYSEEELTDMLPGGNWDNCAELDGSLITRIRNCWIPIHAVKINGFTQKEIHTLKDLETCKVNVEYSDGSVHAKRVQWDEDSIKEAGEVNGKNVYEIHGRMNAVNTGFPLVVGYADPVIYHRGNTWYYIATNDNKDDIGLYVRCAETIEGLFKDNVRESIILNYDEEKGFCQTFWAPEFHEIGGELYILFAVGGKQWAPQSHMMHLKKGGDIMNPEDWDTPVRVCKADGNPLTTSGITLDMTYFKAGGTSYLAWSYRFGIGSPKDTGSMIYIATTDENSPWKLTSEPVLLSRPLYGWENNSGTINNEGPYALIVNDTLYLAYSGGAAGGYSYVVGYLIANIHDNLLDINNWKKTKTAVFSSYSVDGIQGPGHNSFFSDGDGNIMIAYHAQEREKYFKRCSAMHRVHISADGFPMLNVVGERDLPEGMKDITVLFREKN